MLHYYLKKIQYFFFKKNFGFSQTNIDSYFSKKKHTVISFSSIHHKISTIQLNEFFYLTKKFNMIFVKDTSRSWFNNLDIQLIKKNINTNVNYCIGYSMGAFNAIMFSNFAKIKKVIAFSPQFSIHPFISRDKTYLNYAARIKKWKYKTLKFNHSTEYLLIFGDSKNEKYHASQIPNKKNIKIMIIKDCDHETAPLLKKQNKLKKIIDSFLIG